MEDIKTTIKSYIVENFLFGDTDTVIDDMGNPQRRENIISPKPGEVFKVNDVLVVLGSEKDVERLKET